MMGGRLEVASQPDQGSTFAFRVGFARAPEHVKPDESLPQVARLSALVVDDYPEARAVLLELLRHLGISRLDDCASGAEAVERIAAAWAAGTPYDLLILDWVMPGMDGGTVLQRLRERNSPRPARPSSSRPTTSGRSASRRDGSARPISSPNPSCRAPSMNDSGSSPTPTHALARRLARRPSGRCGACGFCWRKTMP